MIKFVFHRPRINSSKALQAAALILAVLSLFYGYNYFIAERRSSLGLDDFGLDKFFGGNGTIVPAPPSASPGMSWLKCK
jgi:hypothetical protein